MSKIVYCSIPSTETPRPLYYASDHAHVWRSAENYGIATSRCQVDGGLVGLVARQDAQGHIWPCMVRSGFTDWRRITGFHFVLFAYFDRTMQLNEERVVSGPARITDPEAANAAVQLMAAECGLNAGSSQARTAALKINAELQAMGLPAGDWTTSPMLRAFQAAA